MFLQSKVMKYNDLIRIDDTINVSLVFEDISPNRVSAKEWAVWN
jgi:hypothetical protein